MKKFTREELFDLVWSESRLSLSKRLGVSDVWIGKACAQANVPVPAAGHWARIAAGQSARRPALPIRGLGHPDTVQIGAAPYYSARQEPISIPPERVYSGSFGELRERARKELGKLSFPTAFERAAPSIAKLLAADEKLRAAGRSYSPPRFDEPVARRKLKLLNGLLLAMQTVGAKGDVRAYEADIASVRIGEATVAIQIGPKSLGASARASLKPGASTSAELAISLGPKMFELPGHWEDELGAPLEKRLSEIAVEILASAEIVYRRGQAIKRGWLVEEKARRDKEDEKLRVEAERAETERLATLAAERLGGLLALADGLRKSDEIRALVAAVDARGAVDEATAEWNAWAREVADGIDPRLMPIDLIVLARSNDDRQR